jgi:Flp pilus assembly protein TadD
MLQNFKAWLIKQLFTPEKIAAHAHSSGATGQIEHEAVQHVVPYDENLLERSRTQWQFGDWESLAKLERDTLQHHPDRAKLALLAAAGHLQQGDSQAARQFTRLAQDWGCSKKLISQILISGVHNSLGRAAAVSGQAQRALQHFQSAIQAGAANSEVRLLTEARVNQQLTQLGVPLSTLKLQNSEQTGPIQEHKSLPSQLTREGPMAAC